MTRLRKKRTKQVRDRRRGQVAALLTDLLRLVGKSRVPL